MCFATTFWACQLSITCTYQGACHGLTNGERPACNRWRLCYAYTESFSNLTNLGPIGIYKIYRPNKPILSMLGADECMQDAVEA